jgi:PAS domain S-box-containing protein
MWKLRDLSLRKKLTLLLSLTAGVGMLLTFALFAVNEIRVKQRETVAQLSALAEITALNSSAALTFGDRSAAEETLRALRVEPKVSAARIYDRDKGPFASYVRAQAGIADPKEHAAAASDASDASPNATPGHSWGVLDVVLRQPVKVDKEVVGMLVLRGDLRPMWANLMHEFALLGVAILGCFSVALVLASRFNGFISNPIFSLIRTATAVSREKNYAMRATKQSDDELGVLTDKFNEMLSEIEARDAALRHHRDQLEKNVAARTAELASAKERLQLAVEGSNLALWDWDLLTGRIYLNECWAVMLGDKPRETEITADELFSLVHPDDRASIEAASAAAIEDGRSQFHTQARIKTRSGQWRWIDSVGRVVERDDAGRALRMIGINTDVTERKLAQQALMDAKEAAEAANRTKSQFLSNMSHEIRTPMNGVLGMTELLLDTELTAKQRRFVDTVRNSGEALLAIINDVLDFSKIEAGKLELETVDFDLSQLMEEVADLLAERAHAKGIELACRVGDDVPIHLCGDPARLRQVLINLVGNAIKFTEAGEVVVEVRKDTSERKSAGIADDGMCATASGGAAVELRFTVTDTGIGIAQQTLDRLFQPFSQADGSMARRYGGTGLGLSISKQLVEMMGGAMGVRSHVGKGSTFWFVMPLSLARTSLPAPLAVRDDLHGVRVLIAEDNATNSAILEHHVKAWGMRCERAKNGRDALALIRSAKETDDPFELALIDLKMPHMNGIELARAIKADPTTARLKLVMLTSTTFSGEAAMARDAGVAAYLCKPVRRADLYRTVVSVLGKTNADLPAEVRQRQASVSMLPRKKAGPILLAEDNPVNQQVARAMLEELGCHVDIASDGRRAVEAWSRKRHALVLMDCQMPELDGFAATAAIRDLCRVHAQTSGEETVVRIVALTANAIHGDRERCLASGMDDYLSKPFTRAQLVATIERWLQEPLHAAASISSATQPEEEPRGKASASQHAVLDARALEAIAALKSDDMPDLLQKVIGLYLENTPKLLETLHKAGKRNEVSLLCSAAHTLKSSSANIGALRLAELCKTLEEEARQGTVTDGQSRVAEIEAEFALVQAALTEADVADGCCKAAV